MGLRVFALVEKAAFERERFLAFGISALNVVGRDFDAVLRLVRELARQAPLLFVLEEVVDPVVLIRGVGGFFVEEVLEVVH